MLAELKTSCVQIEWHRKGFQNTLRDETGISGVFNLAEENCKLVSSQTSHR